VHYATVHRFSSRRTQFFAPSSIKFHHRKLLRLESRVQGAILSIKHMMHLSIDYLGWMSQPFFAIDVQPCVSPWCFLWWRVEKAGERGQKAPWKRHTRWSSDAFTKDSLSNQSKRRRVVCGKSLFVWVATPFEFMPHWMRKSAQLKLKAKIERAFYVF
jgi:hypothetical protein